MELREPINVMTMDVDKYIKKHWCLEVTSHLIYEPASTLLHPEGLFSEIIFGQIGSSDRLYKMGFIHLHTKVLNPHIFEIVMSLKSIYADIISGKIYARYDNELKDLVKCEPTDIGASTGYTFFINHLPKIQFKQTGSLKRKNKLSNLEKYKDRLFQDKCLVIPAGIRDIREEQGRLSSEDINKLYLGLLGLAQAMPKEDFGNSLFDSLKYNIQIRMYQIYDYLENIVSGKQGFIMGKFSARNVALGSRNVITSPPISDVTSPEDPKYFKADETLMPLFQVIKNATPLMVYGLREAFFNHIFDLDSYNISVIDPKNYQLTYVKINENDKALYTTTDGITKLINLFRNENIRHKPVIIKDENGKMYYLYLVYDLEDTIYYLRGKDDFKEMLQNRSKWNVEKVKNLQILENYGIAKEDAIITGSASFIAHGYDGINEDLDIIVSKETGDRLIKEHGFTSREKIRIVTSDGEEKYTNIYIDPTGKLEFSDNCVFPFMSFEKADTDEFRDVIDGYKFENLNILDKVYKQMNRPKDQNKLKWLKTKVFDPKKLRPLTYFEMFYTTAYKLINLSNPPKHAVVTRHPVLNIFGILPTKINIQTTEPNRTVKLVYPSSGLELQFPRYPMLNSVSHDSMSPHPSSLGNYDGDFDGDMMPASTLLSDEANREILNFYHTPFSMVDSNGKLNTGLSQCKIGKYTLYNMSKEPREKRMI